jgi:hypothetical protein
MILRRIASAFRRQDWFTVFVETMIVVLGVFLGLQVNNWNDARLERSREKLFLDYLAEDLNADIGVIEGVINSTNRRLSALQTVIERVSGPLPKIVYGRFQGTEVGSVEPYESNGSEPVGTMLVFTEVLDGNRSAYETMISTGAIGALHDPNLARQIQEYYAGMDMIRRFEERLLFFRNELVTAEYGAGFSWVDGLTAEEIALKAGGDGRLLSSMTGYWEFTVRHRALLLEIKQRAEGLRAAIESEAAP